MVYALAASSALITLAQTTVLALYICHRSINNYNIGIGKSYFQINMFKMLFCPSLCTQKNINIDHGFMLYVLCFPHPDQVVKNGWMENLCLKCIKCP